MKYTDVLNHRNKVRQRKQELSDVLRPYGVSVGGWLILSIANSKPDMRISDIAELLDSSLAYVTTTCNVLEAKGFLARNKRTQDNRAINVQYTGGNLLDKIQQAISEATITTEQYACMSYYDDAGMLQDCTCGKCR